MSERGLSPVWPTGKGHRLPSIAPVHAPSSKPPDPIAELRDAVESEVATLDPGAELRGRLTLERPPKPEMGDYSSNAAMLLAPTLAQSPREVAGRLQAGLAERLGDRVRAVEVAGPGFLNVFMSDRWYRDAVRSMLAVGEGGGSGAGDGGERVLVEFVSANPTGPLTVASGRGAAYGDSLARMLEFSGNDVQREYYINDTGAQVRRFAESIAARMSGGEPPEDGYEGVYVTELAEELAAQGADPDDLEALGAARRRSDADADRGQPRALRSSLRPLVLRALAARVGCDGGGDRRASPRWAHI